MNASPFGQGFFLSSLPSPSPHFSPPPLLCQRRPLLLPYLLSNDCSFLSHLNHHTMVLEILARHQIIRSKTDVVLNSGQNTQRLQGIPFWLSHPESRRYPGCR